MSQTNISTINGQNRNQISEKGGRGQRDPSGGGRGNCRNNCGNKTIVKYAFEGKMKDNSTFKLIITKTGYRPNQYKKIVDTLPVSKKYQGLNEVVWTGNNLVKEDFMSLYPDSIH